jgi:hypothetical protein
MELEKILDEKRKEFEKWQQKGNNEISDQPSRDPLSGDEGTDPDGGCAGQPV